MRSRAPLHPMEVNKALIGTRFGGKLQHVESIGSTSSALLQAAANGAPEGTAIIADEQTAGRGRGGHTWHSAPGDGLYVSVLAKPSLSFDRALWISLATGLAAQAAIKDVTAVVADIRWPNDLLIDGRKCGGILVETVAEPAPNEGPAQAADSPVRYAVIGVGINVDHDTFPPELVGTATSLRLASGQPQNRQALLIALLRHLDHELTRLEQYQHRSSAAGDSLLERFTRASTWVRGKRVGVPENGGYTGTTAGLDAHGFLLVDLDDGTRRTVLSGGVRELI
jgi:BirA family transcriptional regulator, biotin operon repressor / biotin---[acetyl-CoA-carboxylase] ligase